MTKAPRVRRHTRLGLHVPCKVYAVDMLGDKTTSAAAKRANATAIQTYIEMRIHDALRPCKARAKAKDGIRTMTHKHLNLALQASPVLRDLIGVHAVPLPIGTEKTVAPAKAPKAQ